MYIKHSPNSVFTNNFYLFINIPANQKYCLYVIIIKGPFMNPII